MSCLSCLCGEVRRYEVVERKVEMEYESIRIH